nr:MAG TPA: hypothetical protein [Caudoviricetes sp.]
MDREAIEDILETMLIGDSDQRKLRRLLVEQEREMQRLKIENAWLKKVLEDGEGNHVDAKSRYIIDMTKPQPCVKAKEQTDAELAMKLAEEVQEVTAAMKAFDCATRESAYCRYAPRLARDRLGEELTDVITVCVTWLASLGYDDVERGRIQRAVNDKNRRRGYF